MNISRMTLHRSYVADHFHDLPGFQEARHGHNWEVEASVDLNIPDQEKRLGIDLDIWVRTLDYSLLNEQQRLQGRNPTAEMLAQWLLEDLEILGYENVEVRVREKANYWAACSRVGS